MNTTIRLSPSFCPSHLSSSSSSQHSNSFPCPTATPQTSPSSPQFLLNNHSFCSTLFNICQITFFSTYAPCVISKKSYVHHICSIYAPCNSSTILPHALNQNNNAICFPLPSPMPKFENTYVSMPMPHSSLNMPHPFDHHHHPPKRIQSCITTYQHLHRGCLLSRHSTRNMVLIARTQSLTEG